MRHGIFTLSGAPLPLPFWIFYLCAFHYLGSPCSYLMNVDFDHTWNFHIYNASINSF